MLFSKKRILTMLALALGVALAGPTLASAATCGPSWKAIPGSTIGASGFAAVDALSPTDAWAVGKSSSNGGAMSPVARFDGTKWSLVSVPPRRYRAAIEAVAANDVWTIAHDTLGGLRDIEHYDGTSWTTIGQPQRGQLRDLAALSANDVWAVGEINDGNALRSGFIEHWDGTQWQVVPSVSRADVGAYSIWLKLVSAFAPDDVWAVGYARIGANNAGLATFIEHWDGQRWSVVPSPNRENGTFVSSELFAVAAVANDDVWAVGVGGTYQKPLIEHWDGTSWSIVPNPAENIFGSLDGVAAVSADDVWAVGYDTSTPFPTTLILHWDGTSWTRVSRYRGFHYGVAALPQGIVFAAGGALHQLCEISVTDGAVSPASVAGVALGSTIAWSIDRAATTSHSVSDASGMGLFDSGLRSAGGSFTFTFDAAGSYTVVDTATGRASTVKVSMTAAPSSGTSATAFALKWAATAAPAGYVYDVQVKRPGSKVYVDYLAGTADASASFTPDAGAGGYGFRSRIRSVANGKSAGWSSTRTITAT